MIANQLECRNINLTEIDAGQDRGIDKIRAIIESAHYRPLIGLNKIFIFDECQGLTNDAQQALLKVTEEAPPGVFFVFCSTNPAKIIKALKARCQQGYYSLSPMSNKEIGTIIKNICEKEDIQIEGSVKEIATLCVVESRGIPRDAVMMFEKYYQRTDIEEVAKEMHGSDSVDEEFWPIINALEKDFVEFIRLFSEMKRGNYEGFRISLGNVFKKKALKAILANNEAGVIKCSRILQIFDKPVDNLIGDIELISRFTRYYLQ